jgi:integrase
VARLDFAEGDLYVSGQLTRGTRTKPARVVGRKSGAEPYTTVILPALEHELTRRLEAELADGRGQPDDFVLVMPRTGRPPHQRTLTDAVEAAATSAGLGHVTPQMLRRSFASIAARRIPDPAEAAHMTGHSLDVWVRHYVGRFGADARADARRRLLDAGLGTVEAAPPTSQGL